MRNQDDQSCSAMDQDESQEITTLGTKGVLLRIARSCYSSASVVKAADAFSQNLGVASAENDTEFLITLSIKDGSLNASDLRILGLEFFNYLIAIERGGLSD